MQALRQLMAIKPAIFLTGPSGMQAPAADGQLNPAEKSTSWVCHDKSPGKNGLFKPFSIQPQ
jgi:hypothetical protein